MKQDLLYDRDYATHIIAVDLDDVLAAHVEAFVEFRNSRYATNITTEEYNDHWLNIWGDVSHDEIVARAAEFHTHESVVMYEVKPGAQDAIATLARDNDLYIVTARPKQIVDASLEWIDMHFPGIFKDVLFVPIWDPANTKTKADICKEIGATYLIDDIPRHCDIAAAAGITAILFGDYSWNRSHDLTDGVIRCKTWADVIATTTG